MLDKQQYSDYLAKKKNNEKLMNERLRYLEEFEAAVHRNRSVLVGLKYRDTPFFISLLINSVIGFKTALAIIDYIK